MKVNFTRSVRARPDLLRRISLFVFGELLALSRNKPFARPPCSRLYLPYLGQFLLRRVLTSQSGERVSNRRHVACDTCRVRVCFNEAVGSRQKFLSSMFPIRFRIEFAASPFYRYFPYSMRFRL